MPRRLRVDHAGAWHHVMHRGARREPLFLDHGLHVDFLDLLGQLDERFELEVHAFALMTNHDHFRVWSRHGNLSLAMRHHNASYTLKASRFEVSMAHYFGVDFAVSCWSRSPLCPLSWPT